MVDTQVSRLYVVSLKISGLNVGVGFEEDIVLTRIFRLSASERNRFQYLKVKFYRVLERYAAFKLFDKYVVRESRLPIIESSFKEIYKEFVALRSEVYSRLVSSWPAIEEKIKKYLEKIAENRTVPISKIDKLRPPQRPEDLMEMSYSVVPLSSIIVSYDDVIDELVRAGGIYQEIAERIAKEKEQLISTLKNKYEEKILELEKTIENLKKALVEKSAEVEKLKMKLGEVAEDAESIASILGDDAVTDLRVRLRALEELFAEDLLKVT